MQNGKLREDTSYVILEKKRMSERTRTLIAVLLSALNTAALWFAMTGKEPWVGTYLAVGYIASTMLIVAAVAKEKDE